MRINEHEMIDSDSRILSQLLQLQKKGFDPLKPHLCFLLVFNFCMLIVGFVGFIDWCDRKYFHLSFYNSVLHSLINCSIGTEKVRCGNDGCYFWFLCQ